MLTEIDSRLLEKIADLTGKPVGAFNIRKDSGGQEGHHHPQQARHEGRAVPHPRHHQQDRSFRDGL